MSLNSFQTTISCIRSASNPLLLPSQASNNNLITASAHKNSCKVKTTLRVRNFPSTLISPQSLIQTGSSSTDRGFSLVPFDAKSSGSGEEDHRALETVLKLYSAIKNQNTRELSDLIGDECRCVCNFISFFQPFQGKKQVLDFFTYLMRSLGNNIEFVVKPTLHDGLNVGVAWRLEWNKNHVPLGKGFSFYICQIYQGKALIRNVEMFMEPLLHVEPFRLKIMGYMMTIADMFSSYTMSTSNKKKALHTTLFVLFFMTVILFFSKPGFY